MLTEQQLTAYAALAAEVQAAAAKATPGPWACYNGWGALPLRCSWPPSSDTAWDTCS